MSQRKVPHDEADRKEGIEDDLEVKGKEEGSTSVASEPSEEERRENVGQMTQDPEAAKRCTAVAKGCEDANRSHEPGSVQESADAGSQKEARAKHEDSVPAVVPVANRDAPQDSPTGRRKGETGASKLWKEKLEFLRQKQAIVSSPIEQFELNQWIKQAEQAVAGTTRDGYQGTMLATSANLMFGTVAHQREARVSLLDDLPLERPKELHEYQWDDFDDCFERLHRKRLLLLSCLHGEIPQDVEYGIASKLPAHAKKVFTLDRNRYPNGDSVTFSDVLDWHRLAEDAGQPVITFVHITERNLKKSFARNTAAQDIAVRRERLRQRGGYVVCLLFTAEFGETEPQVAGDHFVSIDWLRPVLLRRAGKADNPEHLQQRMAAQRSRGSWPSESHESEHYMEVMKFLAKGCDGLKQELERRDSGGSPEAVKMADVAAADVVRRAVLFVGAYFTGLSIKGFELILKSLLDNRVLERKVIEEVVTQGGKTKERYSHKSVNAFRYWEEHRDEALSECGLRSFSDPEGRRFLDFADSRHRVEIRNAFDGQLANYQYQQFDTLYRSGLLYDSATPRRVVSQLIDMAETMATAYPDTYGEDWLLDTVACVERPDDVAVAIGDGDVSPDGHLIQRFIDWLNEQGKESYFYPRFGDLCSKLVEDDITQKAVDSLLNRLVTAGRVVDKAPRIALRIVRRLRESPRFAYHKWLKHILEVAPSNVRLEVLDIFVREAMESDKRFAEVAALLRTWLPNRGADQCPSVASRYAIGFLFEYYKASRYAFLQASADTQGSNPHHPVFPAHCQSAPELSERVEWLAAWMLHPVMEQGLALILRDYLREERLNWPTDDGGEEDDPFLLHAVDGYIVLADMLEGWTEMADLLDRPDTAKETQQVKKACHSLLPAVMLKAGRPEKAKEVRRAIYDRWNQKGQYYLDLMEYPEFAEQRTLLKNARKRLSDLRRLLRAVELSQ